LALAYLLFRRRKAFWPAALTASTLILFSFSVVGWHNTLDYFKVVQFVQSYYRDYKANLSLLSVFTGIAPLARFAPILAQVCFVAILGLLLYTITRKTRDQNGWISRAKASIGPANNPLLRLNQLIRASERSA
jgi:hypothetical protein